LGSFIVSQIQVETMKRAMIPMKDRKHFSLYIDEFQNFATDSFAVILSEARKYNLSLVVANQYISQIEETVQNAIFGNVGNLIAFNS
jgi:type IV secretory pathway TraG/TraD family ATPase VirD4